MTYAGVEDDKTRNEVIEFLRTLNEKSDEYRPQ
jgi:cytochrome c2